MALPSRPSGCRHVEVVRWLSDDPYPRAEVVELADGPSDPAADGARRNRAIHALQEVCELARRIDSRVPDLPVFDGDAGQASFEIAALSPLGPLDRQRALEAANAGDRLDLLADLLADRAQVFAPTARSADAPTARG